MAKRPRSVEGVALTAPVDSSFWRGRRVFVTGHTGFKGGWLSIWLARLGAHVTGLSLAPDGQPSLFDTAGVANLVDSSHFADVRDGPGLMKLLKASDPEVVFHLAAQPLVRRSYRQPAETFATNVQGTVNLLEAVRHSQGVRVVVAITTDKVYASREWPWPYRETDTLGGHDPYSASKAACELAVASYGHSFLNGRGVRCATARAGNVIGGGDWAEDRLIPDAVRAWQRGEVLTLRRPSAVRPWQHVLEPLAGYLRLAEALSGQVSLDGAFNFGPPPYGATTVRDVILHASELWGQDARVHLEEAHGGPHETALLGLETSRARAVLGHVPKWSLQETVARTVAWYRRQLDGEPALGLCHADITAYEAS